MTTLLDHLTSLADKGQPCPTNLILATLIGRNRSYVTRRIAAFIADGTISTKGNGQDRVITITATGRATARKPHIIVRTHRNQAQPPPCAVCGDPVTMKSNKFARSCDKPSCRASIRYLAYGGTIDAIPWPTLTTKPIKANFHDQNLTFRPDIRRGAGRPLTTSYGVSTDAYSRGGTEL